MLTKNDTIHVCCSALLQLCPAVIFCLHHGLIVKIQVAVSCVDHLRTLHIAKNLLKEENEELFAMIKVVY